MKLFAFSGIRYADEAEAGVCAAPPFDQIDDALRARLHRRRRHFAHLTRPIADGDDEPPLAAAQRHRRWLRDGVVVREETAALYPYEIEVQGRDRCRGLCGLVGLEPFESGVIRPHEATLDKTVDERLSLLRSTRADLEPVMLLAEEKGDLDEALTLDLQALRPIVTHQDRLGHRHRLYRVTDARRIATYGRILESSTGLIADGHHRYTTALRYARGVGAEPPAAAGCKLAVVFSLASHGLRIDPIHRQLAVAVQVERAAALCATRRALDARSGPEIAAAVAAAEQPALALAAGAEAVELWSFDPAQAPDSLASHLRRLAVGWLHDALLPALGVGDREIAQGTLRFRADPEEVLADLRGRRSRLAVWLPPMALRDFADAVAAGRLLPPKSTRFLPKLASGLVWASHD